MFKCQCPECRQSNMNQVYNYPNYRKVECSACGHKFIMNAKQTERYERMEQEWEEQRQKAANSRVLTEYNNRIGQDYAEDYVGNLKNYGRRKKEDCKPVVATTYTPSSSTSYYDTRRDDDYRSSSSNYSSSSSSYDYSSTTSSTDYSSSSSYSSSDSYGGGDSSGGGCDSSW